MAPIAPYLDCGTKHTQLEGSNHSTGAFNNSLVNEEEVNNLRIELQNLNAQHECAIQQLQDCRTQLQAAIEQNERYESFIVNAFLRMDDMETMIGSLREGWFKALGGCIEGHSIEESQNQTV
jgi:outer membrane murein-binding lipoprotein Lpp